MDILVRNHKPNSYRAMKGEVVAFICPLHRRFIQGSACPLCAEERSKRVEGANIQIFKPMIYEDICETPLLIESKSQLRRECRKHNVIAARLL